MIAPPDIQRLLHIRDYCDMIDETLERFGHERETFDTDLAFKSSIVFFIMQIGELVRGLTDGYKNATKDVIEWHKVRSIRNKIVHHYGDIDFGIVWDTTNNNIPTLKAFCDEQLRPYDEADDEL